MFIFIVSFIVGGSLMNQTFKICRIVLYITILYDIYKTYCIIGFVSVLSKRLVIFDAIYMTM